MMKSIDAFFKPVSKRTFKALESVRKEKARDAEEEKQQQVDSIAQERLVEIQVHH